MVQVHPLNDTGCANRESADLDLGQVEPKPILESDGKTRRSTLHLAQAFTKVGMARTKIFSSDELGKDMRGIRAVFPLHESFSFKRKDSIAALIFGERFSRMLFLFMRRNRAFCLA